MENCRKDIIEGLNSAQKDAVLCTEGPSLIIAGAGSGKTRVLTCRVAHILEGDVNPGEILALTFTKKAANEMKGRIAQLVGENKARWIQMGTFHSIFIRFLRKYADRLGFPSDFTIYDQTDSRSIVKQCVKELELDEKFYKPNAVQSRISMAKNSLVTVPSYRASIELTECDRAARRPRFADVYELYQKKCRAAGGMDFDDILLNMNILLRDHADAKEEIAARFKYIVVDEYQDTNYAQYLIIKKLAEKHHNICVVGDDSQSIYSFRGARIENILKFKKDYPEAHEFRLEQNYRSTQTIVNAANSLIAKNENRLKKECFSRAEVGEKIGVIKAFTETEEAFLVASSIIDRIFSDKSSYEDFAILYRTNAQSRALEESLRRKNLPYKIYGGHAFFDRAEIKDIFAYFKLIMNHLDNESFRRVINVPARGIGAMSLERLYTAAAANNCSLFDATMLPDEKLRAFDLKDSTIKKMREFSSMIAQISDKKEIEDCYTIAVEVGNDSGYLMSLKSDTSPEGLARFENIEELFSSIKEFSEEETEARKEENEYYQEGSVNTVSIGDYLENIYLMTESEKDENQDPDMKESNKITLMTVHASKGLEFPHVYIVGMEENLFPSESMNGSLKEIEEERRLFYVALTRAEKSVTVSFAQNRRKWGSEESNHPSRFLKEIDQRYLSKPIDNDGDAYVKTPFTTFTKEHFSTERNSGGYLSGASRSKPVAQTQRTSVNLTRATTVHTPTPGFTPSPVSELRPGQRVEHDRFGFGTILSFADEGANLKAVVRFENGSEKTLLLKFAKLRIAE